MLKMQRERKDAPREGPDQAGDAGLPAFLNSAYVWGLQTWAAQGRKVQSRQPGTAQGHSWKGQGLQRRVGIC